MLAICKSNNLPTLIMASAFQAFAATNSMVNTITALSRWSITSNQLPAADEIRAIHIYDFDNTVFHSPLPNPKIWNGPTLGKLQTETTFSSGSWWHDPRILAATGEGVEIEEPRGWKGWWNEPIVDLVRLSMKQNDVLCILLTGRRDDRYSDLIKKMVASRNLAFDMIVLKPNPAPNNQRFTSTMNFKQAYLISLMETYKSAEDIKVYEDRPNHVKQFREFMTDYNKRQNGHGGSPTRGPIFAEVIHVADAATVMDPVSEVAVVHQIVKEHNLAVKRDRAKGRPYQINKTIFYTGYLISNADTQKLLTLPNLPSNLPHGELKYLANNIMITPKVCPDSILEKVGGMGTKLIWEVTGIGVFENKIWAAAVRPVPSTSKFYTENPTPLIVLALRKNARPIDAGKIQNWQPVPAESQFRFETTVGEKVLLRLEDEDLKQDEYESLFPDKGKRKFVSDEGLGSDSNQKTLYNPYDNRNGGHARGSYGHRNENRNANARGWNGRNNSNGRGRGGGGGRGGNGGTGRGGRRGGGGYTYRSLDDVGGGGGGGAGYGERAQVGYADYSPKDSSQHQRQQGQNGYSNYQQQTGGPPY